MSVSHAQHTASARLRSVASGGLRLVMQKCMSMLSDFDPMVQILAIFLVIKLGNGFMLDKDTLVGTGMLAMMLFEELI